MNWASLESKVFIEYETTPTSLPPNVSWFVVFNDIHDYIYCIETALKAITSTILIFLFCIFSKTLKLVQTWWIIGLNSHVPIKYWPFNISTIKYWPFDQQVIDKVKCTDMSIQIFLFFCFFGGEGVYKYSN
jgi:hypothetical protein